MLRTRGPALALMLLFASACGGSESASRSSQSSTAAAAPTTATSPATTAGPADTPASAATGTSPVRTIVPDVVLRDVVTGADVNLRAALARPDRPTLYWFWAPH